MAGMEWVLLGVSVALMLTCGVFGAAEYSLVAVDRAAVERAVAEGDRSAEGVRIGAASPCPPSSPAPRSASP